MTCFFVILQAITSGIISSRGKVYLPFGYGTPLSIIGVLFILYSDELGTDPRCFIAFYYRTKALYFYYLLILTLIGVIIALIILFNLNRPQTKRINVIEDIVSEGKGSILVCIANMILWILGYVNYMRQPEDDSPSIYCEFVLILGWFGTLIIFVGYALMSKRFRNGIRGSKRKYKETSSSMVDSDSISIDKKSIQDQKQEEEEEQSRPSTRVSIIKDNESLRSQDGNVDPSNEDDTMATSPLETEIEKHDEAQDVVSGADFN